MAALKASGSWTVIRERATSTKSERLQIRNLLGKLTVGDLDIIAAFDRSSSDPSDIEVIVGEMDRAGGRTLHDLSTPPSSKVAT